MRQPTKLSEPEVTEIQRKLKAAMTALDACAQDDLADQVKLIFKEVARRAYAAPVVDTCPTCGGEGYVGGLIIADDLPTVDELCYRCRGRGVVTS